MRPIHETHGQHIDALTLMYGNKPESFVHRCMTSRIEICDQNYEYRKFDSQFAYNLFETKVSCETDTPQLLQDNSSLVLGKTNLDAIGFGLCPEDLRNCGPCTDDKVDYIATGIRNAVNAINLRKEVKLAELVLTDANHTNPVQDLNGVEFNAADPSVATNPFTFLMDLIACKEDQNVNGIYIPPLAWNIIKRHPSFLGSCNSNVMINEDQLANILGLEYVCIGNPKRNIALAGQPVNLSRVWGNNIVLFSKDTSLNSQVGMNSNSSFAAEMVTRQTHLRNVPGSGLSWYAYKEEGKGGSYMWNYTVSEYSNLEVLNWDAVCLIKNVITDYCPAPTPAPLKTAKKEAK